MEIRRCETPPPYSEDSDFLPTTAHQLTPYASPVVASKPVLMMNAEDDETTPCFYYVSPTSSNRERLNSWGDGDLTPTPTNAKTQVQIVSPSAAGASVLQLPHIPAMDSSWTNDDNASTTTTAAATTTPSRYSSKRKRSNSVVSEDNEEGSTKATPLKKTKTHAPITTLQASLQDLFAKASRKSRSKSDTAEPRVRRGLPRIPDLGAYPNCIAEDEQEPSITSRSTLFLPHLTAEAHRSALSSYLNKRSSE